MQSRSRKKVHHPFCEQGAVIIINIYSIDDTRAAVCCVQCAGSGRMSKNRTYFPQREGRIASLETVPKVTVPHPIGRYTHAVFIIAKTETRQSDTSYFSTSGDTVHALCQLHTFDMLGDCYWGG